MTVLALSVRPETLRIAVAGRRRSSAVSLTRRHRAFAHLFHDPEIIAVDPAHTECCGSYSCPFPPRKPNPPRKWGLWG